MEDDEIRLRVPTRLIVGHLQTREDDELIRELGPEALQQGSLLLVMLGGGDDVGDATGHGPSMARLPPTGKALGVRRQRVRLIGGSLILLRPVMLSVLKLRELGRNHVPEPGFAHALEVVIEFNLTEEVHETTRRPSLFAASTAFDTSLFRVIIDCVGSEKRAGNWVTGLLVLSF
jgi:hypothetical protein